MNYFHTVIAEIKSSTIITSGIHTAINVLPYIIIASVIILFILFLRKILSIYNLIAQEQVFLELTPPALTDKSAYTTQQFISVLHNAGAQKSIVDKLLGRKTLFSFEIVSTKEKGIRYLVRANDEQSHVIERMIIAYLPQVRVRRVEEYVSDTITNTRIVEFKLKKHFAFPLAKQDLLTQHDPVAYITGMMTKLSPDEMIALQLVISPTKTNESVVISHKVLRNEDVLHHLHTFRFPGFLQPVAFILKIFVKIINVLGKELSWAISELANGSSSKQMQFNSMLQQQNLLIASKMKPARVLSSFEQEAVTSIQEKINQSLFETSLRVLISIQDKQEQKERIRGIKSSFAPFSVPMYQSLYTPYTLPLSLLQKMHLLIFKKRLFSLVRNRSDMLLSVSEIADLYHFPYSSTTKTENIVKSLSRELPAPLSLKNNRVLAVVFGKNTYGGTNTPIGVTSEERKTHKYVIGRTGSGKTTMLFAMAKADIENGQGITFIDPHGDVSEDLLAVIPENRKNDLVYINPVDLKYPIGINLLELTPGLEEDDAELEKEVVCEGVISLFRKVFSKEENANAHRIEYILRNTIHTAFTVKDATIFTVYDLLTNPPFQKIVIKNITDPYLQNFWKYEFGKAGDYQVVKMVSGVTAKIGRFLFSPTARRILEQKKSTIDFGKLMDQQKIILCNFSQGNLGEDTARLLGTTVLTKIQQAALRRAKQKKEERKPFYLYVDEFQNFATNSFIKMLSEGRKYGLSVTIAEQSTSQQEDRNLVHNILANVTTVVCFRSANPVDEELMLAQFAPYVKKGDIGNLSRYHFYCKISAFESEEPFSGETVFIPVTKDQEKIKVLIEASRKNYATIYNRESKVVIKKVTKKDTTNKDKPKENRAKQKGKKTEKIEAKKQDDEEILP